MTPPEVADILATSGEAVVRLARSISPEVAAWRPAPQEWCVNECVGHLIEAETKAFAGRIRTILDLDEPSLEAWDAAVVASRRNDCEADPHELAREFETLRAQSLDMLRSLGEDDLPRLGVHVRIGRITVEQLLHQWVHHDANHLRQAYAIVEAYVWPAMGNTQTFSRG